MPSPSNPRPARHAAQIILLCIVAFAAVSSTGCKTRLRYSLGSAPDYTYRYTAYKGDLDKNGKPIYTENTDGTDKYFNEIGNLLILVSPISKNDSGTGTGTLTIKTMQQDMKNDIYGNKYIGTRQIELNGTGEFSEKSGTGMIFNIEDLFFELPDKSLRKGDTWSIARNVRDRFTWAQVDDGSGNPQSLEIVFEKPIEFKYTYQGNFSRDGDKCALLKMRGDHEESSQTTTADGYVTFTKQYHQTGDIYFSLRNGRVHDAVYERIILYDLTNSDTGDRVMQVNNVIKKEYKLVNP